MNYSSYTAVADIPVKEKHDFSKIPHAEKMRRLFGLSVVPSREGSDIVTILFLLFFLFFFFFFERGRKTRSFAETRCGFRKGGETDGYFANPEFSAVL